MHHSSGKNDIRISKNFIYFILVTFILSIVALLRVVNAYHASLNSPSRITVQTGDGKQVMYRNTPFDKTEIPSDIPKNLPIYPHLSGNISYSSGTNDPGLSGESTDDIQKIYQWFLDNLPKNGWSIICNSSEAMVADIFFEKSEYTGALQLQSKITIKKRIGLQSYEFMNM